VRVDLSRRAEEPELLDIGVPEDEALRSLADLRFVNRWFGGRRTLIRAALPHLGGVRSVLDVGCGSCDLTALLAERAPGALVVGLDRKFLHVRDAPRGVQPLVADVERLPFSEGSFDVVTASLFLHHFDKAESEALLRSLYALARRVLIVNDLCRGRVPYFFGRAFFPLLFSSPVSVNDGLVSIRRAFTRGELVAALGEAGIPHPRVASVFPYRLVAVCEKP
jgi:SAM-dependent methyltransferase